MRSASNRSVRRCQPWLGTLVEAWASGLDHPQLDLALNAAFGAVAVVHRLMSYHSAESDVSRLNRSGQGKLIRVHPWTWEVLAASTDMSRRSGGVFDVTMTPRLVKWGLRSGPWEETEAAATWESIELVEPGLVRLRQSLRVDLGGVAKGFAVDRAVEALQRHGVSAGGVNAGGDLRVFGSREEPVFIRHPAEPRGFARRESIQNRALATSAAYETRARVGGELINHCVHPKTGRPASDALSVSVIAGTCMIADALTKVVLLDPSTAGPLLDHFAAEAWILSAEQA